jgi:glucose dehydrogenase
LLTKTLLFIGEGLTNVFRDRRVPADMPTEIATNSGAPFFRAYKKESGETIWEVELEAGTSGTPVSYMYEGRQYVVVAIGDSEHSPELVAFALPE